MLLAEDLLLLLTDDDSGKLAAPGAEVDIALGGAFLEELVLMQRVGIAGVGERVAEGRLVVRQPQATGDGLLDEALTVIGAKEGRKPRSVVPRLGKRARVRLYERLVASGVVRSGEGRILGVFPTHRWPSTGGVHESSVRAGLVTALHVGTAADERTAALISLLFALRALHKAVDPGSVGLAKKELIAVGERIAEGDRVAKAVRQAIDRRRAAIVAAGSSAAGGH